MNILPVILIGVGLSMDAFAVSLTGCMTWHGHRLRTAFKLAFFFGFFQALMPVLGWMGGKYLAELVSSFDHWIAFGLLAFVGGKMIVEAVRSDDDACVKTELSIKVLLVLSIATSIDAFAVGLSFALLKVSILIPVMVIGTLTFCISFAGVLIGEKLGKILGKKAEIIGGLILIVIGLKILVEHLKG